MQSGKIPEQICYAYQPVAPVKVHGAVVEIEGETFEAQAAFAVDAANPRLRATALAWANDRGKTGGQIDLPNQPLLGVRVLGHETRGNGGSAWKVLLPGFDAVPFLVDLRDDVLLDVLTHQGVAPGGRINDALVWAQVGGQTRLVSVHSRLYDRIVDRQEVVKLPTIPPSRWVVGGVYRYRNGDEITYLGRADSERAAWSPSGLAVELRNLPVWIAGGLMERWAGVNYFERPAVVELVRTIEVPRDWREQLQTRALTYLREHASTSSIGYSPSTLQRYLVDLSVEAHLRAPGEPRPVHPLYTQLWREQRFTP